MKTVIAVLIMALCIYGCAQTKWCHPTKGPADFERDKWECVYGRGGNPDALMMNTFEMKR